MLTLITGSPGNGKTALAVKMASEVKNRPIFVMGIPDLKIPHQPVPPVGEWTSLQPSEEDANILKPVFTFPPNSIIIIDEAQNVYRPRAAGSKVPDIVAAFETHRHAGIDFWLITQHPSLLDSNVRRLLARHIHIRATAFGRYRHEWPECGDPDNRASRELSRTDRYKPPKGVFGLYKSAETHTKVKVRMPWYVYLFAVAFIGFIALGWRIYSRISEANVDAKPLTKLDQPQQGQAGQIAQPLTKEQYIQQFTPREFGRMETAPAYDKLVEPKTVPVAVACYESERTGCKCITQQGTKYETTQELCRDWLHGGIAFQPWREDGKATTGERSETGAAMPSQHPPPQVSAL